jgi:hypothetical protein
MEKLIELLNEYVEETDFWDNLDEYNEAEILDEETLEVNWKYHDIEYLYTKKFWFIKWLVENDRVKIPHKLDELPQIYGVDYNSNECKSDRLIMLLSISDTPIEFLISILKNV